MRTTRPIDDESIINAIESGPLGANGVSGGTRTVTTAGTAVQLSVASVPCKRVFIQALSANTGVIAVGGSGVLAASMNGQYFYATQGDWFEVSNLNLIYIDASVNGEGVGYYYETI